ncbi:MAG: putative N-acetyltransferase [Faunusvirus sp.]|jgi:ribosomal protein S18 acetylase RimI-like enzyme|uniref:Putative N-acetyltransferase n=1 Tax=Faunusvirus sp. TaxID=2487766 RepID=A0A3G4ZX41_9VIRU|nr:MAG: putative N-acetyltransferase [Faunusvirus sp.]
MKLKLKIRLVKRKDRYDLKNINEKCLPENYDIEFWESMIAKKTSYLLFAGSLTVGYILCDDKWVLSFAILKEYRKQGWGTKLLNEAILNFKTHKYNSMNLHVRVDNDAAKKLYESVGFTNSELVDKYYTDGTNAYLMRRKI